MIRIFATIAFALSIAFGAYGWLNYKSAQSTVPTHHVIAATVDMPAGTLLRTQDLVWQPVVQVAADEFVQPSAAAIKAKPDIAEEMIGSMHGAVLRRSATAGKPILKTDIVKPGERDFLHVVLRPGTRAIAIPVATGGASTGLLSEGDRVDVVLTQKFSGNQDTPLTRRSVSETVVQNLRVLAINNGATKTSTAAMNPSAGNFGRTVTLEVTPQQAEVINVAIELGKLSVTLRNTNTEMAETAVDGHTPINAMWAGDVSKALFDAARPKPTALAPKTITVIRGKKSVEVVKFDEAGTGKVDDNSDTRE